MADQFRGQLHRDVLAVARRGTRTDDRDRAGGPRERADIAADPEHQRSVFAQIRQGCRPTSVLRSDRRQARAPCDLERESHIAGLQPGQPPLPRVAPLLGRERGRVARDAVTPAADHFCQRRLRTEGADKAPGDAVAGLGETAPGVRGVQPPRTLIVQFAADEWSQKAPHLGRGREEVLHVVMPFFMNRALPMSATVGLARAAKSLRVHATRRTRS